MCSFLNFFHIWLTHLSIRPGVWEATVLLLHSPFFLVRQRVLGELGEVLGVLLFYLYPEREAESFITTKPLRNLTASMCVSCVVQHSDEHEWAQKGETVCFNDNCTVFMATWGWSVKKGKGEMTANTFLVWTLPSLSAFVSPSAVSAAKPQILWRSRCPGDPSYRSMS